MINEASMSPPKIIKIFASDTFTFYILNIVFLKTNHCPQSNSTASILQALKKKQDLQSSSLEDKAEILSRLRGTGVLLTQLSNESCFNEVKMNKKYSQENCRPTKVDHLGGQWNDFVGKYL